MFRLALQLGFAHPDHLLKRLTSRQLSDWYAFASIEPFGELQADFRAGQICSIVANVNRDPDKSEPFTADDFMPSLRQKKKPKEDDGILLPDPEQQTKLLQAALFKKE